MHLLFCWKPCLEIAGRFNQELEVIKERVQKKKKKKSVSKSEKIQAGVSSSPLL